MLKEVKRSLPVFGTAHDAEIARLCKTAAMDLEARGVILPGRVEFSIDEVPMFDDHGNRMSDPDTDEPAVVISVTDLSTLKDELIISAICAYVRANLGNPPNYAQLKASYDEQKAQLMMTSGYTDWGDKR